MCSDHKLRICNTCWTGMHDNCCVQLICTSEDLREDLNIAKRHIDMMEYYALVSDVAVVVDGFTQGFEVFVKDVAAIESEVKEVVVNKREEEYNNVKDHIIK